MWILVKPSRGETLMKYCLRLITTVTLFPLLLQATTNKTTFIPRPKSSDITLSMLRWHSHTDDERKNFGIRLRLTPFYTHSTNGSELGKYFMFGGKNTLTVAMENADIHPYNFNLATNFEGKISLRPKQEVYGTRIDYFQHIPWLHGLYVSANAPILHVCNDPGLHETISSYGELPVTYYGPRTVTKALAGHYLTSDWAEPFKYGKINGKQVKAGISDIDAKLGYTILNKPISKVALTLGVTFPTSNKPEAVYVFEPLLGNGSHWALGVGLDSSFRLWESKKTSNRHLSIIIAGDYRYLLQNTHMRTLELKGKNWGRYTRMRQGNPNNNSATLLGNSPPGVNPMTRAVNVTPGSHVDAEVALCLEINHHWHIGAGYNIWLRNKETVHLKKPWGSAGTFGLASLPDGYVYPNGITPAYLQAGPPTTEVSSKSTIGTYAEADGIFIKPHDIDTAPHPCALSHKLFCNADFTFHKNCMVGAFGAYEFASNNTVFDQWNIGLKIGASL